MTAPMSTKNWLFQQLALRERAGLIPPIRRGTAMLVAQQLEEEMAQDARDGICERAIPARSIRVRMYENKLWPPSGDWLTPAAVKLEAETASVHFNISTVGQVEISIAVNGEVIYGNGDA